MNVAGSAGPSNSFESGLGSSESLGRPSAGGGGLSSSTSPNHLSLVANAAAQNVLDKGDEEMFPASFATSTLLDLKDSISGNNGKFIKKRRFSLKL